MGGMEDEQFNRAFDEIDLDGGGQIEFDEFVEWLAKEELDLQVEEGEIQKPSFEQLAKRYNFTMDRLMELYKQFCSFLPEGTTCKYPDEPGHLTKEKIRGFFTKFDPDTTDEEFEEKFALVDFDGGGEI